MALADLAQLSDDCLSLIQGKLVLLDSMLGLINRLLMRIPVQISVDSL